MIGGPRMVGPGMGMRGPGMGPGMMMGGPWFRSRIQESNNVEEQAYEETQEKCPICNK